ncbi:complement C1q tumor necrosis factor-related protein 3-like isoform X2 [Daphnia pulicaria]|uniref:complement C1q tumor necrosis factor-related protein 3-like isoform X2 n=1 Tax=Daphnia pulicaria TaxID=35523 RepID=UPI001EEC31E1|nr:complement C1q tumor necrosis factor-related protein 3-like isoform X2 [Daphnia pulicaria]
MEMASRLVMCIFAIFLAAVYFQYQLDNPWHLSTELKTRTSEIVDIGQMPTSCADLQRMGHKLNGFFLVKGLTKLETLYCDFYPNQNDIQKWIGYADVKSTPVHFHAQRNSSFSTEDTPIPFDLARVNEGNAMDLTSGKFTAPRPGIYSFSFAGIAVLVAQKYVSFSCSLYLNNHRILRSYVNEERGPIFRFNLLTFQSTLNLRKGDQVWVQINYSSDAAVKPVHSPLYLYDDRDHHMTHFIGFLLEEEIVASL